MKNLNKYFILYTIALLVFAGVIYAVDTLSQRNIQFQKQILLKEAQSHYAQQINTRKWNASYGGLYAFAKEAQEPNPYLKNNTLKTDDNKTLIKINPAWMTRQLSEISDMKDFHFRITSLNPINPKNKATPFEKRALEYIEKMKTNEYYELSDEKTFNYMGALYTTQDCLVCHQEQGYKVGDIRGGISVNLNSSEYEKFVLNIGNRSLFIKFLIGTFLLIIVLLIKKQLQDYENLNNEVHKRTQEIKSTKELLQQILDADLSLLIVTDGENLIFTNKTLLDFFELSSQEEFMRRYKNILDFFNKTDKNGFIELSKNGKNWIEMLQKEQNTKELQVTLKKYEEQKYFRPHAKKIIVEDKALYLIIFDEITQHYKKVKELKDEASKDTLTKLFNRRKFNDVLEKEIVLSQATSSALSIIFLDIDHFKVVNDTLGHDVGDEVLVEIAQIISLNVRENDFVARWGGEEFIITLQSTDKKQAAALGEKIRQKVEEHTFKSAPNQKISLGVTQYIESEAPESFTKRVDNALYQAKQTGRNKVVIF